jgi:proline iminopeptidase
MVLAYHAQLNAADEGVRLAAARAWSKWECVQFFYIYLFLPKPLLFIPFSATHLLMDTLVLTRIDRMTTSRLFIDQEYIEKAAMDDWANAFARIENHYFVNEGFMKQGQLLEKSEIDKM